MNTPYLDEYLKLKDLKDKVCIGSVWYSTRTDNDLKINTIRTDPDRSVWFNESTVVMTFDGFMQRIKKGTLIYKNDTNTVSG